MYQNHVLVACLPSNSKQLPYGPFLTQLQSSTANAVIWYYFLSLWFLHLRSPLQTYGFQSDTYYPTGISAASMQDNWDSYGLLQTPSVCVSRTVCNAVPYHYHWSGICHKVSHPWRMSVSATFLCWNHVLQDCTRWPHQHGASTQLEVSIRSLLSIISENRYKDALLVEMTKWSQAFSQHFMDVVHPVTDCLWAWQLHPLGVDRVAGNQLETFRTVTKQVQQWK